MSGRRSKRLGVLGTFVWDRIWRPGVAALPVEQWGGLAYSLAAMSAACPEGWEVVPIARVGADLADSALEFISSLPGLTAGAGVQVVSEPNNRVELRYRDAAERTERLTGGVPPWRADLLLPLLADLDALYINFFSGYELDLPTAARLRQELRVPLYADLHSLFLGPPSGGPRAPRRLPRWREWLGCFDVVQLNETELSLIGAGSSDLRALMSASPPEGPALTLVTRRARGASFARRPGAAGLAALPKVPGVGGDPPPIEVIDVPTPDGPLDGDPTGCGDVWGSVAFAGLLQGLTVEESVVRAHRAAAAKIRNERIDTLRAAVAAALTAL